MSKFVCAACLFACGCLPLQGQVYPVPIPGGVIGEFAPGQTLFINLFFPGVPAGSLFNGLNAEPHAIINSNGVVALGYTAGKAKDSDGHAYNIGTDIRVYQGKYVGARRHDITGGTISARAHGTFVFIWVDFFDPSSGSQVHDFNPGFSTNGLIWVVQVPDDAVVVSGDTLTIHVANQAIADEIAFPGTVRIPSTLSFDITYTKSGRRRTIEPTSRDPLSAFHWAGEMWMATNSGTFSVSHNDGSFSATGSFSSSGMFGEMGTERNGIFLGEDDQNDNESGQDATEQESVQPSQSAMLPSRLRARIKPMAQ